MFTLTTETAIELLNDIYYKRSEGYCPLSEREKFDVLKHLTDAGLIRLINKEEPLKITSYQPARNSSDVSLMNILQAIHENLECTMPVSDEFYLQHGMAARKLGVANQVTRTCLEEIKLYDL